MSRSTFPLIFGVMNATTGQERNVSLHNIFGYTQMKNLSNAEDVVIDSGTACRDTDMNI